MGIECTKGHLQKMCAKAAPNKRDKIRREFWVRWDPQADLSSLDLTSRTRFAFQMSFDWRTCFLATTLPIYDFNGLLIFSLVCWVPPCWRLAPGVGLSSKSLCVCGSTSCVFCIVIKCCNYGFGLENDLASTLAQYKTTNQEETISQNQGKRQLKIQTYLRNPSQVDLQILIGILFGICLG